MKKLLVIFTMLLLVLSGCSTNELKSETLEVVTSTTMLGDLVLQIGQEHVDVTMLFGPGIDPHSAQPTGGDTKTIQNADLVVFSGLDLETHFHQILAAYGDKTIQIGDMLDAGDLLILEGDEIDPHYWFSVPLWQEATRIVGDALIEADPDNAEFYEENTVTYIETLQTLHEWIMDRVASLDENQRILVTAHDAFGYFAKTYGFEVAAIGGISTESEITAKDINDAADVIVKNNVKSIFIESTVPQTTVDAVVEEVERRGSSVEIGNELYSDALGTGEDAQYINAIRHNVESIVEGLE